MITLELPTEIELTEAVFGELCRHNPDLRLERTAKGELVAMAPAGSDGGRQNLSLSAQLWLWNQKYRLGVVFDSSAGFTLPNGAIRSPDASWIRLDRWEALTPAQRRGFAPICPDFVLELKSPSDDLSLLQGKLKEYMANGAQLGWLVDPHERQVYCYRVGAEVEVHTAPRQLSGEPLLPDFSMDFDLVWS